MSFWSQNFSMQTSQLDDLLCKEDVTLKEVIDEPEVIQECKSQHKKLIEFLTRPDILKELIVLSISEPNEDDMEVMRYKYASIACELLTCEAPPITQALVKEQFILSEIYGFLENEAPLNPLLASFCCRIMTILISKPNEQNWFSYQVTCLKVLEFLKSKGNFVKLMLKHIGTSAIMDLILRMYEKIEGGDIRENFLSWLDSEEFVELLVFSLNSETTADVRSNVCSLLCDLIVKTREAAKSGEKQEDDPIAKKLESVEFLEGLLHQMFKKPKCEGCIVGGISVLIALVKNGEREEYGCRSWSPDSSSNGGYFSANITTAIVRRIDDFRNVLRKPPKKSAVRTTVGVLDPPLGITRVEVARLVAELFATGSDDIIMQIQSTELLNVLFDLFFQYPWNNFLHAQVEAIILAAFKSSELVIHVLFQCRLMQRILDAWEQNDAQEEENKPRKGYMGHVIAISNHITKLFEQEYLSSEIEGCLGSEMVKRWHQFEATSLAKVNGDMISKIKVTEKNENEDDYLSICSSYTKLQSMSENFAGAFFEEETISDTMAIDDSVENSKPDFGVPQTDAALAEQAELFNLVCSQKLQSLDDDSEPWSGFLQSTSPRDSSTWNDGGSSDEEQGGDNDSDDWSSKHTGPVEQYNPWSADVLRTSSPPEQGWANFEVSPFLANFGFDLSSTIATATPGHSEPVPFDLTPTETQLFPSSNNTFWPSNESSSSSNAALPSNNALFPDTDSPSASWPFSPEKPSETPPCDVETPPADKEDSTTPSPIVENESDKAHEVSNAHKDDSISVERVDAEVPRLQESEVSIAECALQDNIEMERAQVIENESSAEIVNVSDIIRQDGDSEKSSTPSSSQQSEASDCSSLAANVRALPSETVIEQTELLNDLSAGDSDEVAAKLADLLAEVSVDNICRTLPGPDEDVSNPERPENASSVQLTVTDDEEPKENVPIVSPGKVAAEDDVTTPQTPVTAI